MALPIGVYRIYKWGSQERPEVLSIIDGNITVAPPSANPSKNQEVTRRFLTSLYSVSYQLFSGSSRSQTTA